MFSLFHTYVFTENHTVHLIRGYTPCKLYVMCVACLCQHIYPAAFHFQLLSFLQVSWGREKNTHWMIWEHMCFLVLMDLYSVGYWWVGGLMDGWMCWSMLKVQRSKLKLSKVERSHYPGEVDWWCGSRERSVHRSAILKVFKCEQLFIHSTQWIQ